MSRITSLLRSDAYITVNKCLAHALGTDAAQIFSELCARYEYFEDRGQLDEEGYFYNTQDDLQAGTALGERAQRTAIKLLVKHGLITTKLKGIPATRHFKVIATDKKLIVLLDKGKEIIKTIENRQLLRKQELDVASRSANNNNLNKNNFNKGILEYSVLVKLYFSLYGEWFLISHPYITAEQIEENETRMQDFMNDNDKDIDIETMKAIINKHFATTYKKQDYNVNGFTTEIMKNRYYEIRYD